MRYFCKKIRKELKINKKCFSFIILSFSVFFNATLVPSLLLLGVGIMTLKFLFNLFVLIFTIKNGIKARLIPNDSFIPLIKGCELKSFFYTI